MTVSSGAALRADQVHIGLSSMSCGRNRIAWTFPSLSHRPLCAHPRSLLKTPTAVGGGCSRTTQACRLLGGTGRGTAEGEQRVQAERPKEQQASSSRRAEGRAGTGGEAAERGGRCMMGRGGRAGQSRQGKGARQTWSSIEPERSAETGCRRRPAAGPCHPSPCRPSPCPSPGPSLRRGLRWWRVLSVALGAEPANQDGKP